MASPRFFDHSARSYTERRRPFSGPGAPLFRARARVGHFAPLRAESVFWRLLPLRPGGPRRTFVCRCGFRFGLRLFLGPRPATRQTSQTTSFPFQARARGLDPAYACLLRACRRRLRCRRLRLRGRSEPIFGRPRAGARPKRANIFAKDVFSGSRRFTAHFAPAAFCSVFASSPFAVFLARHAARRLSAETRLAKISREFCPCPPLDFDPPRDRLIFVVD